MAQLYPPVDLDQDPTPQTPRYGLFDAAVGPNKLPVHARVGGVRYQSVTTDLPEGFEVLCETSRVPMDDDCGDWVQGLPFVVMATMRTSPVGVDQTALQTMLLERLRAGEQAVVEAVFADALVGAAPSLANNVPPATTLAAALNVVDGVGDLEAWLYARQGPKGVLHLPLRLAGRCQAMGFVTFDGRTWRTPLGTAVAFGNYSGTTAAGAPPAAGHTTLYVTGSTTVWCDLDSDIEYSPWEGNVHWPTNEVAAFARRTYIVTHNEHLACVDVDIDGAW